MKVFVRLAPDATGGGPSQRAAALVAALEARGLTVVGERPPAPWQVVGSPAAIDALAPGAGCWIRGLEAGGACGEATALVLIRAAAASGRPWVAEGLGARAMAAAVAVGAAGIVLDAHLWLTAESALDETQRRSVRAASSGLDTLVVGEIAGLRERRLAHGGLPAPQHVGEAKRWDGFGLVEAALAIADDVRERARRLHSAAPPADDPLGTGVAVAQGPMANVAEGTGLAKAVRAAGALPFAALGALEPERAAELLRRWADEVPRPWGVGIIGFDVMPFRDRHLDLVASLGAQGPSAVILAGGSKELALACERRGLAAWLHTPSARLAEQALAAGVRAVIFEGHEAGGHVGRLTSVGLWEEGLAAVERSLAAGEGAAARRPLAVLAGGLGCPVSAAFARAMGADAAAAGATLVLQAGTAFLLTHEAVERGQVTPTYQARALSARGTVLVGSTVNLPLRCVPNEFTEQARALEQAWEAEGVPRGERRAELERHNLGRTRLAAKGIERNPDHGADPTAARYRPVPTERQDREGAFTIGMGAVVTPRVATAREVVRALSIEATRRLAASSEVPAPAVGAGSRWGSVERVPGFVARPSTARGAPAREGDIAVVGVGCVLPGALDVAAFWRNLVEGVDSVGALPDERWPAARYWDPAAGITGPVRSYARHAGVVRGFVFDALRFRIPPKVVPTLDPSQRLALAAAGEAVASAGWSRPSFDRRRAAVVLGNSMGGEFSKSMAVRVRYRDIIEAVARDELCSGWSSEEVAALERRVEERIAARLPPVEVDSMAGLLANVVAGRVGAWLDWMGGNLTVDAACAASLAAVAVAVDWLRLGRCDAVLAGGVDTDLSPESYVGFCRTEALSRTGSSPFSTRADGFVMGEGAAVLALKRLTDAVRDGDPVWAVIRGVGQSSDGRGRGITAPRAEGQALAMERAYAEAGLGPDAIGVVEAHGTGTALGDETELGVLRSTFAGHGPVWLGSVKSQIGHLKGAAGAAGLLKAVLSLRTGVVPATLHARPMHADLTGTDSPFRLPMAPVLLPEGRARAAVSAFGFGGTDFHVLLEAPSARSPSAVPLLMRTVRGLVRPAEAASWAAGRDTPLVVPYGASDREGLLAAVREDRPTTVEGCASSAFRLVLLTDPPSRAASVDRAARWLASGPAPGSALGAEVFLGAGAALPVVLGFPGQGAQRQGAVDALSLVPAGARALDLLELPLHGQLEDRRPLREREQDGADPVALHALLFALGVGWTEVLRAARVPVLATVGHSVGAVAALVAAGAWTAEAALPVALARGRALAHCPEGAMLAVRAPEIEALELAARFGLALAAVNGPDRCVLAGAEADVELARAALGPARARRLEVARAYHSPSVAPAARALDAALAGVRLSPTSIPAWSARTGRPIVDAGADLVAGVVEPVRFHDAVVGLRAAGPLTLVECGPGTTLCRVVEAAGGIGIPLDPGDRGPAAAAARLLALGHPGLAQLLPGTLIVVALPAPEVAPVLARESRADIVDHDFASRARAVTDLRIASLADASLVPVWHGARDTLALELAEADRRAAGGGRAAQPAAAASHPAMAPRPLAAAPPAPRAPDPEREEPSGPAPSPIAAAAGQDPVRAAVLAAICEVTGYPAEFVTEGADLEGDLGVDSIRKMEILGLLEQRLGFVTAESDYATLADADLGVLVRHVRKRLSAGPAAAAPAAASVARCSVDARVAILLPPGSGDLPDGVLTVLPGREPAEVVAELSAAGVPAAAVLPADAGGAAAAGFLRSLARERGVTLPLVHVGGRVNAQRVTDALCHLKEGAPSHAELHLDADGTWEHRALDVAPGRARALPERPVILATGGSAGIVAACLRALADLRPRVLLLARTAPDLARERLRDLTDAGCELALATGDVADLGDVQRAAAEARERWGRIDVVIHGAGVLRDRPAERLTPEDVRAVLTTKWDGARHLLEATREDPLAAFVTFSSVVAHLGNAGQTAYAAANAALETLRHPRAARTLALAWTAWSGVGMAADPHLQALLASRGVRSLPPDVAAAAFARLLLSDLEGTVRVTAQPLPGTVRPAWPLGPPSRWSRGHTSFPVPLDPTGPVLADHRVGGRPLVPAAVWIAAFVEAARLASGRDGPWSLEAIEITAPTFVDRPRDDVRVELVAAGDGWAASVHAGDAVVCRARLRSCAAPADHVPPIPLAGAESAAALYRPDLLFHGPAWRVLEQVSSDGPAHASADLRAEDGERSVAAAVDGVHQLLAAWSGRSVGWLGLPVGADRWVTAGPALGPIRVETVANARGREVRADVIAVDGTGRVVLRGEGIRLRAATPLPGLPDA